MIIFTLMKYRFTVDFDNDIATFRSGLGVTRRCEKENVSPWTECSGHPL